MLAASSERDQLGRCCATTGPFPLSVPQPFAVGGHPIEASLALTAPAPASSTGHVHSDTIYASPTKRTPFELPQGATSVPVEVFTGEVTAPQFSPLDVHLRTVESGRTAFSTRHARTWVAVVPGAPPALQPIRMTLDVTEPTGGLQFAGTVFINQLAPQSVIRPVTVTLSAGATTATFPISTTSVTANTTVTISGELGGVTRTAVLGVNTSAPPPSLTAPSLLSPANDARFNFGTTINFDWSDVTGAASYALQIDDASDFSVPLTVAAEVTVSQYSNSTLPRTRFYWRVRALDAAGVAGPWSAVRRVEVR